MKLALVMERIEEQRAKRIAERKRLENLERNKWIDSLEKIRHVFRKGVRYPIQNYYIVCEHCDEHKRWGWLAPFAKDIWADFHFNKKCLEVKND